jgi:hypothetical protein
MLSKTKVIVIIFFDYETALQVTTFHKAGLLTSIPKRVDMIS